MDSLHAAIDGLVTDGTLTGDQANQVYTRVRTTEASTTVSEPTGRRWTPAQRIGIGVFALGGVLLMVALLVAAFLVDKRPDDFDWSGWTVVVLCTLALAGLSVVAGLVLPAGYGGWFASGNLALGIFGLAIALGQLFDIQFGWGDWISYLLGAVLVAAGAGAYMVFRGSALMVPAAGGVLLIGGKLIDDLAGDGGSTVGIGSGITVIGLAIVGAGYVLPSRNVTGVLGAIIAYTGPLVITYVTLATGAFTAVTTSLGSSPAPEPPNPDINGDIMLALALGVVVTLVVVALYVLNGFVGYPVLAVLGGLTVITTALMALDTDNRLKVAAGVAVVGGVVAVGAMVLGGAGSALRNRRSSSPSPSPSSPS